MNLALNSRLSALLLVATAALMSGPAAAAIDVTEAVSELNGMLGPIALLGGAALVVTVVIKVWKRMRGAA